MLLERLLLGGPGADGGQHPIGVGGAAGGQPGARGAQPEFDAVAAALACAASRSYKCGGAGVIAGTHGVVGAIDLEVPGARRWSGSLRAAGPRPSSTT